MNCPRCGAENSDLGVTQIEPVPCVSCGQSLAPSPSQHSSLKLIRDYFHDVWEIIVHPTHFFRRMPSTGGLTRPLAFALVTHWLGAILKLFWQFLMGGAFMRILQNSLHTQKDIQFQYLEKAMQLGEKHSQTLNWIFGVGPVLIDPFLTLGTTLFTAFFVFVGARILVSPGREGHPHEISFESALKITCYGLSPAILSVVPVAGSFLAYFWTIVVTVIGTREIYRIQTGRAIVIALFPNLLFLGIILLGLMLFLGTIIKIFFSFM